MGYSHRADERTFELLRDVATRVNAPVADRSHAIEDQTLQLAEALGRRYGFLPQLPTEENVATVTFTIGTTSRDYSTITSWEADLDNGALYSSGDDAVGECYNDSTFNESVTINGGATVGLNSHHLTVATGEKHDGTAGTGARIDRTGGAYTSIYRSGGGAISTTVSWLELTCNGTDTNRKNVLLSLVGFGVTPMHAKHLLCHNIHAWYGGIRDAIMVAGNGSSAIRNIVYDNENIATIQPGIRTTGTCTVANNTVVNNRGSHSSQSNGIDFIDNAGTTVKNNIACDTINNGSGSAQDFEHSSPASASVGNNLSSDTTAPGTGSLTSKTAANQFVSTVAGSEDYHLKTGSDAEDAGANLGSTPTGIDEDIDGAPVSGTWDMGADEFVAVGGAAAFPFQRYYGAD